MPRPMLAQFARASLDSATAIRADTGGHHRLEARLVRRWTPTDHAIQYCPLRAPPCATGLDSSRFRLLDVSRIKYLEVQTGTHAAKGATIGGVVGLVIGGFVGELIDGFCDHGGCSHDSAIVGAFGGALFWGGFGALIGSGSPKWGPVPP